MPRHDSYHFAGLSADLAALLWDLEDRVSGGKPAALTKRLLAEARSIHDSVERHHRETGQSNDERWAALTARLVALEDALLRKPSD